MNKAKLLNWVKSRTENQVVHECIEKSFKYDMQNVNGFFVYMLVIENKVCYVGKSVNPKTRISQHINTKPPFDSVYICSVSEGEHELLESLLINEIKTEWNIVYPKYPKNTMFSFIHFDLERKSYEYFRTKRIITEIHKPTLQIEPIRKAPVVAKKILGRGLQALLDNIKKYDDSQRSITITKEPEPSTNYEIDLLKRQIESQKAHIETLKSHIEFLESLNSNKQNYYDYAS